MHGETASSKRTTAFFCFLSHPFPNVKLLTLWKMSEEAPAKMPITDTHRKIVFSFLRMLQQVETDDRASFDVVVQILSRSFGVDAAGVGGQNDSDVDMVEAFESALRKKAAAAQPENDEKFAAFLDVLRKKGYFNGAEEGTEEHKARVQKALAKYPRPGTIRTKVSLRIRSNKRATS